MKTPLRYQITEFDCGSISIIDCLTYLFDREEIPAELIKAITEYTLDCHDSKGNLAKLGTSANATKFISRWIADFCRNNRFGLVCAYLGGKELDPREIKDCIIRGGCVHVRSYKVGYHYFMVTGIDEKYVYIFDPYWLDKEKFKDKDVEIVDGHPFTYNRKVTLQRFLSTKKQDFSLGPVDNREVVLFYRSQR